MKQSNPSFDVFDFREEDHIENEYWKPSSDVDQSFKYQMLVNNASSKSVMQTKEVPTVDLDEDDEDDSSPVPLDSPQKDVPKGPESFSATPVQISNQHCLITESSVGAGISSHCLEMGFSAPLGFTVENDDVSPMVQESLGFNGEVNFRDVDGTNNIQNNFPSTSDSELEENNVPSVGQAWDQFTGDLEMDDTGTVVIHTDYIRYGDKCLPASVIIFSRDSFRMKQSTLEEESSSSWAEWKPDDILKIDSQSCDSADLAKLRIRLLEKNAETADGVEVVECLVHGHEWFQQQERIMSLNQKYKALLNIWTNGVSSDGDAVPVEERENFSDPFIPDFEEAFEEVVYPKGDIDAVSVRKSDVDLLQPDVFVNDTIIDFYITYLKNEIPREQRDRFHFFSSFFFRKLADLDKNPSSISDGKAAFQRVRRWTRKVNIFEKDYIFIPVNYNLHWSLIVLCHLGEVANFNDEDVGEASKVPCILHMDSIRGSHAGLKDLLQSYLLEEWKERRKETYEDTCSKFLNLRFLSLKLPQQENCSDCGLFLLHYAELFLAEAPPNFSPFRINEFENFLKPDWFMPGEASLKRIHIQRLIHELLSRHSNEHASRSGNIISHSTAFPRSGEHDSGIQIISEKRCPEKSWNGDLSYTGPVHGMELGQLGMSLGRVSHCSDQSAIGMPELLGHCQSFGRGASVMHLGFATSTSRAVDGDVHHVNSGLVQNGLQPIDQVEAAEYHGDYASGDCDQMFTWNSNFSDLGDHEDNSSPGSEFATDDSVEEMSMFECNGGEQITGFGQNEIVGQSEEIVGSSAEGYASASSDVMETPAEDSQEMGEKYGISDQEDPIITSQELLVEASQEELGKVENGFVAGVDEKLLVEGAKVEDEAQAGLDDCIADGSLSGSDDGVIPGADEKLLVGKVDGLVVAGLDDRLVLDDTSSDAEVVAVACVSEKLLGEDGKVEDEVPAEGLDNRLVVDDSPPNSDNEQPTKRRRISPTQGKGQLV